MPTRNVKLTDHQERFIRDSVASGRYADAGDVVGTALRLLERQEAAYRLRLERLRQLVEAGAASIDRGEYETVTRETLGDYMASIVEDVKRGHTE